MKLIIFLDDEITSFKWEIKVRLQSIITPKSLITVLICSGESPIKYCDFIGRNFFVKVIWKHFLRFKGILFWLILCKAIWQSA